ncbi:NUDIX domain-containing protein [Thalassotalea litorea]|uniref:NUDIX domain-containing protein n=1 Tax=Thalassotalea litorea TaxID=2020715 RepID=A0A5R9IS95_9GAMM|nr:NUDIX domain-containing protein [Thalassotalea litorea]TLU64788.1 NUDIX domain-containing protein [Thalassotalea litorea]
MTSETKKATLKDTLGLPTIASAGGLVYNDSHHILLMFKRGKWDMPKGRIEENQAVEITALREVNEETGLDINKLEITGKLVSTWHTTRHGNTKYLKKTHWFLMKYSGDDDKTDPQIEEGIIECRWVHLSDLPEYRELLTARVNYVVDFWHQNMAYTPRK